jgi:hypothetical protein
MSPLREFEIEVLRHLVKPKIGGERFRSVIETGTVKSYEHTGVGYFLVVSHPILPKERLVCHKPLIMGRSGAIECGFVAFIEGGELTFECHSWGESDVPKDIRERSIEVFATE